MRYNYAFGSRKEYGMFVWGLGIGLSTVSFLSVIALSLQKQHLIEMSQRLCSQLDSWQCPISGYESDIRALNVVALLMFASVVLNIYSSWRNRNHVDMMVLFGER